MTSKGYEIFIKNLFQLLSKEDNLKEVEFYHNKRYQGFSRTWDVDVSYNFVSNRFKFLVFIECKYWNKRVEASHVSLLQACLQDCSAHKGIIATTMGFQSGALEAAERLGIGLLIINDVDNSTESHNFTGNELNFSQANEMPVYSNYFEEKRSAGIIFPQFDFYIFMRDALGPEITEMFHRNDFSNLDLLSRTEFAKVYDRIKHAMKQYRLLESGGLSLELLNSTSQKHFWALELAFTFKMFDS